MTLSELKSMDKLFLTPLEVSTVIGCDPVWIRVAARDRPDLIPFPFIRIKSRTKIPRLPFIRWLETGETERAAEGAGTPPTAKD